MNYDEIRTQLIRIFQDETLLPEEEFLQGQELATLVDSLTILEIVYHIEEQFDLEIDLDRLQQFTTFAAIEAHVADLLTGPSAGSEPA